MEAINLLEKYIVCKLNNNEETIFITNRSSFEKNDLCETYSNYGIKVGCYDAGCYCLDNSASDFKSDLENALHAEFPELIIHEIMAYNDLDSLKHLLEYACEIQDCSKIIEFAKSWIEENEKHFEVNSWEYHDGHNWKSIILNNENGLTNCEELEEDDQIKILEIYENEVNGTYMQGFTETIETENYAFHLSRYQDNPFRATLEIK